MQGVAVLFIWSAPPTAAVWLMAGVFLQGRSPAGEPSAARLYAAGVYAISCSPAPGLPALFRSAGRRVEMEAKGFEPSTFTLQIQVPDRRTRMRRRRVCSKLRATLLQIHAHATPTVLLNSCHPLGSLQESIGIRENPAGKATCCSIFSPKQRLPVGSSRPPAMIGSSMPSSSI
jgi:hypothetical protein